MVCGIVRRGIAGGVLAVVALSAGCATWRGGQAKEVTRTVTSMERTRAELARAQVQVDDVLAAMSQLTVVPLEGLRPAFKAFTSQVSQTVSQAEAARRRADAMRGRWREYIESWEVEIDRLSSPELQAKGAERRQTVRENYGRLRDVARALDDAYQPFLRQLRDIQRALSLDLTPEGVRAAQSTVDLARKSGGDVRARITDFIAEIDRVMAVSPPGK
ncbi:MAG: DUF2959 family protein [Planctomycetes bacterium]|nr:DUF2959 family protein [Planctomycetota bacterium]